jgi:hypothetical protein
MSSKLAPFEYEYALVVNNVPKSAINGLTMVKREDKVNIERAALEIKHYMEELKKAGIQLIELDPDERYPDCVFVEVSKLFYLLYFKVSNFNSKNIFCRTRL